MNLTGSGSDRVPSDIVSLRMSHCRAEQAALAQHYHLAVMHYRTCLEAAESRQDHRATQFFALKLAGCYAQMGLVARATSFMALAEATACTLHLDGEH